MEEEAVNDHHDHHDSDEEDDGTWGRPNLLEVSKWTGKFLTNVFTRRMSNEETKNSGALPAAEGCNN